MVRLSAFPALLLLITAVACRSGAPGSVKAGNGLFAQGKYEEASLRYRKAIQIDRNFGEAYFRLALTNLKLNQGSDAYQNLKRASELLPDDQEVKRQLAEFYLGAYMADPAHRSKFYDQAKELAGQMLAVNPKSADALRLQGYVALLDKKPDAAIELLGRSAELNPNDPAAPLSLAETLMKNGRQEQGEQLARDLIRRKPDYGPVYDMLYRHYISTEHIPEAAQLLKERIAANPKDSVPVLELAKLYSRLQKTAEVEATLKTLTDRSKDFPQAYQDVGDFHVGEKNFAAAEQDYERGMAADSARQTTYLRRLAALYLMQSKAWPARRTLERILAAEPADPASRTALAGVLTGSQDSQDRERGIALYRALLEEKPNSSDLHFALGRAYQSQGNTDQARREFQESAQRSAAIAPIVALAELSLAQQEFDSVLRFTEEGLKRQPGDPRLRLLRAQGMIGTHAYTPARFELNRLVQDYPPSMDVQVQIGLLDIAERRYREAETHFQKLYQPANPDLRPLRGLVQVYLAQKQPARALQVVQDALKRSPETPDFAYLWASTASAVGELDVAEQQLKQLVVRFPNLAELRIQMATLQSRRGELAAGYENLKKARDLEPLRPGIDALLAVAEDSLGMKADAQAGYRKALSKDPKNTLLLNNLAFLLAESGGSLDEALQLAEKGLQKQPDDAHLMDTVAWIYIKKQQAQVAASVLQKLTRKYPDDAVYHYHYALALLGKGDKESARPELEVALQKHPTQNQQKQIQEALQRAR